MAIAAALTVDAPTRTPAPYGLFSTFTFRPEGERRWANGVEWESLSCAPASGIGDPNCEDSAAAGNTVAVGLPKGDAEKADNGDATPFSIYFKEKCDPVGRVAVAQERATTSLLLKEQIAVEHAIWTGDLGNSPNFVVPESTGIAAGSTASPASVLGAVTKLIRREIGGLGVIHVGYEGAATLAAHDLLKFSGESVTTIFGDPVSIGAGYDEHEGNSGTGAADPGNVWMIGTPPLFGYRSDIFTSSAREGDLLDRGNNDFYAVAERQYVIGWDPCAIVAAQFNLDPGVAA